MRPFLTCMVLALLTIPTAAQQSKDAIAWLDPVKNPVSKMFWGELHIRGNHLLDAAERMPGGHYLFKPTPNQESFASLLIRSATNVRESCSAISGEEIPELKIAETAGKKEIVAALRDSFELCYQRLGNLRDTQLGEHVHLTREMMAPRAAGVIGLLETLSMNEGVASVYLRLNDVVPPSHAR